MSGWEIRSSYGAFLNAVGRKMSEKHTIGGFFSIVPGLLVGFFVMFSIIVTYLYGMFLVLPALLVNHQNFLNFMRILGNWMMIAVFSNIYLIGKRTSSIRDRNLPQPVSLTKQLNSENEVQETTKLEEEHFTATPFGNPENWHMCSVCEVFVPPRTWHCNTCNTCILRRDHHCAFTGTCIGEENQSNFIGLMLYLSIGSILCAGFSLAYHMNVLDRSFLSFILQAPVLVYTLIFDFDLKYIMAGFVTDGQLIFSAAFVYFAYNTLKGQTSADAHRKVYYTSFRGTGCGQLSFANMRSMLGPHPILRLFWPFHSPLKINYDTVQVGCKPGNEDRKNL